MQCSSCGSELIAGKRFCHACGTPATVACRSCHTPLEPGWDFCPDCGTQVSSTPVERPAPAVAGNLPEVSPVRAHRGSVAGERKQVTVLFCDLANSTEIAEPLDPEEYREILDLYLQVVMGEIERADGVVNQLAGDGVMALFGAPLAREDAPERAVSAALAIQSALSDLADPRLARRALQLEARVGIHTGLAVVGTVGTDSKMDYTAIGDTTNLASRLESLAQPGSVLVSEPTRALLSGQFRVEQVGPFEVKGKSQPLLAYKVCCQAEARETQERELTPFVGRHGQLALLEDAFRRAGTGLAQMISVIGEAGSGKSRLIHEFKASLAPDTATILEARCSSLTQSVSNYIWIAMLQGEFRIQPSDTPRERRRKIADGVRRFDPELDEIFPFAARLLGVPSDDGIHLPPDELKRRSFKAISRLCSKLAMERPLILLIEDLHWIDEVSRHELELAATKIESAPILLLVSHRPEYQPHWQVSSAFTQLVLGPLPHRDVAAIVRSLAGGQVPPELERPILEKAEGNPFYAEEITRVLVESGDLVPDGDRVRLTRPVEQVPIPNTVTELLGARLDRLPPEAKRVAQAASVIGREFRSEPLERLLAPEAVDIPTQLAELERRGIVYTGGDLRRGVFRFGESLTQEVAYESLLLRERRRLHGEVARHFEETRREPSPERASVLAHHYARSDDQPRAVRALLVAALEAETVPDYPAMVRFHQQAWQLASDWLDQADSKSDPDLRAALQAAIGAARAYSFSSRVGADVGLEAFERGCELARRLDDAVALAELLGLRGGALTNGDSEAFTEGLGLLEHACAVAQETGQALATLRVSRTLGFGYLLDGRLEDSKRMFAEVVAGFEELGHRESLSDAYLGALTFRDRLLYYTAPADEVEIEVRDTLELAERASNRTVQNASASKLARLALDAGDLERALEWALPAVEMGTEIGNLGSIRTAAAVAAIAQAELHGHVNANVLHALDRVVTPDLDVAVEGDLVSEALIAAGQEQRALEVLAAVRDSAGGRLRRTLAELGLGRALARQAKPDLEAAREALERALELAEVCQLLPVVSAAALELADLELTSGRATRAVPHLSRALEASRAFGLVRNAERATALLARTEGEAARRDLH